MVTDEASPQPTAPESGPDQKAAAAPDTTTGTAPLGLALSGGGVRAALFSLGVVIGLIETECHRRVRCVASVSGGSILNAALAHEKSLASFSSLTEFEPLASKLAASLAWGGAFAFEWRTVVSFLWNLLVSFLEVLLRMIAVAFVVGVLGNLWEGCQGVGYRYLQHLQQSALANCRPDRAGLAVAGDLVFPRTTSGGKVWLSCRGRRRLRSSLVCERLGSHLS